MPLDPKIRALLASIRSRVRRYIITDSLLALLALLLGAFWLGLVVDLGPVKLGGTEMPRSARVILLAAVLIAALVLLIKLLIGRLAKPIRDDSLALLVERHHPELSGRLVTAVQLAEQGRSGDYFETNLLQAVHDQAVARLDVVEPNRIFRWQPIRHKSLVVVPLAVAAIGFAIANPSSFSLAARRLLLLTDLPWPRRAYLEMVGVELPSVTVDENEIVAPTLVPFEDRQLRLPIGSSGTLRIMAEAERAVVPDVCTVYYTTDDGARGQANMRRVGRVVDGKQTFLLDGPPLAGLTESVTLYVRGLDARLDDYRVEAVQPPAIATMRVISQDPAYLQAPDMTQPTKRETGYQAGLRIREGSQVSLVGTSTDPLGAVDLRLSHGNQVLPDVQAVISEDRKSFTVSLDDIRQPSTLIVLPRDPTGIVAQLPYRYFLGVIIDDAPQIEMRLRGIGTAVTPVARIPLYGKVTDDYGVQSAKVELNAVSELTADDATVEASERGIAPLEQPAAGTATTASIEPDRDGNFELTLDLRELAEQKRFSVPDPTLKDRSAAINFSGDAVDAYNLAGTHVSKTELIRLEVVTPDRLLMLMERRELALRGRLEQAIEETRGLRESLDTLRREAAKSDDAVAATNKPAAEGSTEPSADSTAKAAADGAVEEPAERLEQILRLRAQQNALQATKTRDELSGIAESLDDLLVEMQNNRVDSVDRSERIGKGVRDPLRAIVGGDLEKLRTQISEVESAASQPALVAEKSGQAVKTAEDVLLQLTAVLEKMLDLESFNEILDMVRELIDAQDSLIEETKSEQKKKVRNLFED